MTTNELLEIAEFCFPWSAVSAKDGVVLIDGYSITQTTIEVDSIGGKRKLPGYVIIRESAPDEWIIYEGMSIQKGMKEIAKELAVESVSRAFEIYDPCLVVNPEPL